MVAILERAEAAIDTYARLGEPVSCGEFAQIVNELVGALKAERRLTDALAVQLSDQAVATT